MKYFFIAYLGFASIIAWWDFDFDARSQYAAKKSVVLQMMYMSNEQKSLYIDDVELVRIQIGILGISGMEAHEIQNLANQFRSKRETQLVEYPSRGFLEMTKLFILVPYFMATAN